MMGTTKRRLTASAVVMAAAVVAVQTVGVVTAAAATLPVGSVKVVSVITPFDSNNKVAAANCPAGTRVIGGGGFVSGTGHAVLTELRPIVSPTGDTYQVSAAEDEVGERAAWALLAYAFCAANPPEYEIVSATSALSSGSFTGIAAVCPNGKYVVGSGGRINGGLGQVDLLTLGEGGTVSNRTTGAGQEDTNGFAGNWSVTAYAVCVKSASFSDLQMVREYSPANSDDVKSVTARCPAGKRATGGAGWADGPAHVVSIKPENVTPTTIQVGARDPYATAFNWQAIAVAFCAS